MQRRKNTSRLRESFLSFNPNFDVNELLNKFHSIDQQNTGIISYEEAKTYLQQIGINASQAFKSLDSKQTYQFDQILSILGTIERFEQPSLYVIQFVNLLVNFKNERLKQDQQNGLVSANQIDKKIKSIFKKEIQRKILQIQNENNKTIQELYISQSMQIKRFEDEWNSYINEAQIQTKKKVHQTIDMRNKSFYQKESRMAETSRRRYSVLTSTKLIQLQEKKKNLVNQSKYNEALLLKDKIVHQKQILKQKKQNQLKFTASRRYESLNKKKDSFFETKIMLAHNNVKRLYKKKKDQQQMMKIRFSTLKKQTLKKLDQRMKKQISKLKSLFYEATKR